MSGLIHEAAEREAAKRRRPPPPPPKTPGTEHVGRRPPSTDTMAGWRAFNRLSAAVSRHLARSQPDHPAYSFPDDCDDDLHRAYTRILRDIGPPVSRETVDEDELVLRGGSP